MRTQNNVATIQAHLYKNLFFGCSTSQPHAHVSQGQISSNNCTCCHIETDIADQTCHPSQLRYTNTEPASPSADPITPGSWQGSHWSTTFQVTGMTPPGKIPVGKAGFKHRSATLEVNALTTRLLRRSYKKTWNRKLSPYSLCQSRIFIFNFFVVISPRLLPSPY